MKSVEKRHFGTKEGEEPKILIDNAAALFAQLSLLDRRFFFCLDYEQLAEIKSSALQRELALFLHEEEMPRVLTDMIKAIRPSSTKPAFPTFILNDSVAIKNRKAQHNSSQEYLAFQLQARLALIDQLCHSPGRPAEEQLKRPSGVVTQSEVDKEEHSEEEEEAPDTHDHAEDGGKKKKEEEEKEGRYKRRASTNTNHKN